MCQWAHKNSRGKYSAGNKGDIKTTAEASARSSQGKSAQKAAMRLWHGPSARSTGGKGGASILPSPPFIAEQIHERCRGYRIVHAGSSRESFPLRNALPEFAEAQVAPLVRRVIPTGKNDRWQEG
jgi:hypothetical protein